MEHKYSAGFGRIDISPTESVPLGGYGNTDKRMSQGVLDPLMATCVAIEDAGGSIMMLYTVDQLLTFDFFWKPVVAAVSEKYGISKDAIAICSTHTHSAPDINQPKCPSSKRYLDYLIGKMVDAADLAMADRKPASLSYGQSKTEGLTFVRHYYLENGTIAGPNFGDFKSSTIRCPVSKPDRQIQLIRIDREGGKPILLVNWQCHAFMASAGVTDFGRKNRPYASADFIGGCRDYIEKETDFLFAFFQGASGNLSTHNREDPASVPEGNEAYGKALGQYVLAGLDTLVPMETGGIAAKRVIHDGEADHTQDHLVPQAQAIYDCWLQENNYQKCVQMGKPYDINGPYHASGILRKARAAQRIQMEVGAGAVGDIGFVFLPYEAFDTNGMYIKEHSPYKMTFILTSTNGWNTYIPSALGFTYSCYEHNACGFAPGAGEEVAELTVSMLEQLHKQN